MYPVLPLFGSRLQLQSYLQQHLAHSCTSLLQCRDTDFITVSTYKASCGTFTTKGQPR